MITPRPEDRVAHRGREYEIILVRDGKARLIDKASDECLWIDIESLDWWCLMGWTVQ